MVKLSLSVPLFNYQESQVYKQGQDKFARNYVYLIISNGCNSF